MPPLLARGSGSPEVGLVLPLRRRRSAPLKRVKSGVANTSMRENINEREGQKQRNNEVLGCALFFAHFS